MKKTILASLAVLLLAASSCDIFLPPDELGEIYLRFSDASFAFTKETIENLPDTNNFILSVKDSKGSSIYEGPYGSSPESILVGSGSYTVSVLSSEFKEPKFSAPQYGDRQVVVVEPGKPSFVELICRQMNSGVRLRISSDFLTSYPQGSLLLKNDDGKLLYGYSERRVAYFNPGAVSLVLSNGSRDDVLLTRTLESQEILTLSISAPAAASKGGVSIQIDTMRNYLYEDYVIGSQGDKGQDAENAMNVSAARSSVGTEDVWVYGYIVGGDLTSSSASFKGPFKSRTNLVIASRASTSDKSVCMSVQLQKGNIRDVLNLVDNPDMLGTQVFLKGDIVESYYGIPGLQNITEFKIK